MSKNRSKGGQGAICLNKSKALEADTFYRKTEAVLKMIFQKLGG